MARPSRQEERRSEILDAAIGLIERHDLASLRITDVAAELGLTANAVRYYFKDMDQLLADLALRSDVRFYDERLAVVERTDGACAQLALTIAAGLPTGPEELNGEPSGARSWQPDSSWTSVATSRASTTGRSSSTFGFSPPGGLRRVSSALARRSATSR